MLHPYFNYLVGLVGLSLTLVSCEKSDVNGVSPEHDAERSIVFGSWLSKAPVTDVNSMTDFKVWGWAHKEQSYTNLFNGTKVFLPSGTYEGGLQYWMDGCKHDFYGLYPYEVAQATMEQSGKLMVSLDASGIGEQAVDLMTAATKLPTYTYNKDVPVDPVPMTFSHELAKVNLSVKALQQVTVNAKLVGVSHLGNLTKQYVGTPEVWTSSWNLGAIDTEQNSPFQKNGLQVAADDGSGTMTPLLGGALLLPPQALQVADPGLTTLQLVYTYEDGQQVTKNLALSTGTGVTQWEAGKSYNYTVTIPKRSVDVTITVSVTDWNNKDISTTL